MENAQIANQLQEIADLLEIQKANPFRVRSYRSAARTVQDASDRLEDMVNADRDLSNLPNIGESTAEKIVEMVHTGSCKRLKDLRKELPSSLTEVMHVNGIGPRKVMQLYRELGIESLQDLQKAGENGEIQSLDGFGKKTEKNILKNLKTRAQESGRMLYKDAADHFESLQRRLHPIKAIKDWAIAGSFRRARETIGDLDVIILASQRNTARKAILDFDNIDEVNSQGKEKISVRLSGGLQVDFRFFEQSAFGAALLYFTGSKTHNIALRKMAQSKGWKLNEYGLFSGKSRLAGKSEKSVYKRLGLDWIPPELREDNGEMEAAQSGRLPVLVQHADIQGDLQSHTTASDGQSSVREMAIAAKEKGYAYFAITDHSKRVTMAQGLDDKRCRAHADHIRQVNEEMDDIWLMAGIEVDILKSGDLDLKKDTLKHLDWVVASIHYDRNMSKTKMTDRLLKAIESGVVHTIAHPLGRIIGRREPIEIDLKKVFQACAENKVCLEINAHPSRLDLPDIHCREAMEAGVHFTLGTDAHKKGDLDFMHLAVNRGCPVNC